MNLTWLTCLLCLAAVMLWTARRVGPRQALGTTVFLSFLVPTWVICEVDGLPVNIQLAAALVGLGIYCVHPRGTISFRIVWLDLAGLSLLAVHLFSDWTNDGFSGRVPLRAYGEWFVPYIAGRLAIQSLEDVRKLLPVATIVILVLGVSAVAESVFRIDASLTVFGAPPADAPPPLDTKRADLTRWDLKRATGPTMNPIYFGGLQLLLFPWAVYAVVRVVRGSGRRWWYVAPAACAAGIVATLSRGPQAALFILVYLQALILWPRGRLVLVGFALLAGLFIVYQRDAVLEAVLQWGGGRKFARESRRALLIDGEQVPHHAVSFRLRLYDVYGTAMRRAGPFGFGTEAVTGFPVNVPLGPGDAATVRYLRFLDNAYILLVLRFGYVGLACFVLAGLAAAGSYLLMALTPGAQGTWFYAGMAATILAAMVLLAVVWMPQDFGFLYLWTLGTASGLRVHGAWKSASLSPRRRRQTTSESVRNGGA